MSGNHIGPNFNGDFRFGNANDGVRIGNASNALIGGREEGARNVDSGNDAKDPDTGPNGLQNFPVLTSASETRIVQYGPFADGPIVECGSGK